MTIYKCNIVISKALATVHFLAHVTLTYTNMHPSNVKCTRLSRERPKREIYFPSYEFY